MEIPAEIEAGAPPRRRLPLAPPLLFTEPTTTWSVGIGELQSPVFWELPRPGFHTLPAAEPTGGFADMGITPYGPGQAFAGGPRTASGDLDGARSLTRLEQYPHLGREFGGFPYQIPARTPTLAVSPTPTILVDMVVRMPEYLGRRRESVARLAASNEVCNRYWRSLLSAKDSVCVDNTLRAVLGFVFDLMQGELGNQLFQKLVSSCGDEQLRQVVHEVAAQDWELVTAAKNAYGMRCVRRLITAVRKMRSTLRELTAALSVGAASLMMDPNGFNVIQTCLCRLNARQNEFIYKAAQEDLKQLARSRHGCLALCKCIDHALPSTKDELVASVISSSGSLSQDPFGNYVVQHVLQLSDNEHTDRLCMELKGHVLQLSTHKHGSHVVEKCVASNGRRHLVDALLSCKELDQIACDSYGNYVIQKMLRVLKQEGETSWREQLLESLRAHERCLKCHPNGIHVHKLIQQDGHGLLDPESLEPQEVGSESNSPRSSG